jgi:hypothetical protein
MPKIQTARLIKFLGRKNWYRGTALYELDEAVTVNACGFHTSTCYVIVADTPHAADHGLPETTIFAANKNGSLFGGFWDRDSPDPDDHTYVTKLGLDTGAEFEHCRVVGRNDHKEALKKLGYRL